MNTATNTYGAVLVAGAGNGGVSTPFYPAAYDNVLAVAGTDAVDVKAATSNFGAWVDVSAPSETIRTTALGGGWVDNSGTSFASPFAAGLAGLIRTLHPDWNQATVRSQIVHTTDNIDGSNPSLVGMLGSGRLNAGGAMQVPHPILSVAGYSVNGLANGRATLNATSSLALTLGNDWWDVSGVTGTLSTADGFVTIINGSAGFGNIPAAASASNTTPFTFSVNSGAGYNHAINFTLNITSASGYSTALNFTVNTDSGIVNKSGTILSDQTWTSDQTYLIVGDVGIALGITLTIQPGTTVKFNGNYSLNVGGKLIADGSSAQPIFFKSNSSGTWNHILFDDPSVDATADGGGAYLDGSILRYVNIEGSSGGIDCTTATPYLAHVTLSNGGVVCPLGATPAWFSDNTITGGASFSGDGSAYRNTVSGGLTISGAGIAEDNVVSGGVLSLGSGTARRNTASGGLTVGGSGGTMEENDVTGNVSIGDTFSIVKNTIKGSLTVGNSAIVDHNTVSNGITVGSSATVTWNNVEDAGGTCLTTGDGVTAQYNRLIGCASGMSATSGSIEHNLIANNTGVGLQVGAATVQYNTLTGNTGNTIVVQGGIPAAIAYNNLDLNTGTFDIYSNIASGSGAIPAGNNWWGTTDDAVVANRIFDINDDYNKAAVTFAPKLSSPDQTAPGYVRSVSVSPDTTLGIQTGTFEVQFSKPMDTNQSPQLEFYDNIKGTWSQYNTSNSVFPSNNVGAIAIEPNGTKWFAIQDPIAPSGYGVRFDGISWTVYNSADSKLSGPPTAIAIEPNGTKWFGTGGGGVSSFDGIEWKRYSTSNSGLPSSIVSAIAIEANGTKWFGTSAGVASFDGTTWTVYNTSNSGLPSNSVKAIVIEADGTKWFGTWGGGVAKFDGTNWTVYNTSNSGLPYDYVNTIAIEANGTKWFGTYGNGIAKFDGTNWMVYNTSNSGLSSDNVRTIAIESDGTKWFGTDGGGIARFNGANWKIYKTANSSSPTMDNPVLAIALESNGTKWFGYGILPSGGGGAGVLQGAYEYPVTDSQQWSSSSLYHTTYDITSAIPKATYRISLSNALDPDGMRVAPFSNSTFNVDYAGAITDKTPPSKPNVTAVGNGSLTTLSADWGSSDAQSPITMYRYAIGTSPGARDVVAWTYTANTSVTRAGLNLTAGVTYYVSAGARNQGGLWSESGVSNGVTAGVIPPSAFVKSAPVNGAVNQAANPTLSWGASSSATSYEYCYDTINNNGCDGVWISTGTNTSIGLSGLANSATYYWQVRAINAGGAVQADGGSEWSFTTSAAAVVPGAFDKSTPANGAVNQSTSPTISWGASNSATSYEYCYDTTNDNACSAWMNNGVAVSKTLSGLKLNSTYYWQVRAVNAGGTTYANSEVWWSFKVTRQELAKNGGFNTYKGTSKIPTSWVKNTAFAATDGKDKVTRKEGFASVKINGAAGKTKTLTQTLIVSGAAGKPFTFSYWAKGKSIPATGVCQAQVTFYNGKVLKGTKTLKCPTGKIYNWKQAKLNFTAPAPYTKIIIKFTYSKSSGTVWFDLVSLLR